MEKKYVVYEHVTPDGMYYFGQTQNVKKRWSNNGAGYKGTALYPYIEKYGWDNIKHIVLFRDQTKEDALWIEDFLIQTAREDGVCINKQRSGNVSKEDDYNKNQMKYLREHNREDEIKKQKQYYEDNKDKIKEQHKQYREQNKDKILEQQRDHYQKNREKILEQKREYYQKNKDKSKQYYEQNKDKIKQYREQNKDKRREYDRQYRQRKKLEKQLKEAVETTPLF